MRRITIALSIFISVLLLSTSTTVPQAQARPALAQTAQLAGSAGTFQAFIESLTSEQIASIEEIVSTYQSKVEAFVPEASVPAYTAGDTPIFLPLVQAGNLDADSTTEHPTLQRNPGLEKEAAHLRSIQEQINAEIKLILTNEQLGLFERVIQAQPALAESGQSAASPSVNQTYCYYAYNSGYDAQYYAYWASYYGYYAYLTGSSNYAYYAYRYGDYTDYYGYATYYYSYYCYYG